jgi:hypothetical protein
MAAVLMIEESWAKVCRRIYQGLQTHYGLLGEAMAGFDISGDSNRRKLSKGFDKGNEP